MALINVQRGVVSVAAGGTTGAPTTPFASLNSAFVVLSNNRKQSAGIPGSSANLDIDDMSGGVRLTGTNQLTFDKIATSLGPCDYAWESWEYTGSPGGSFEFIVRGRTQLTLSTQDGTATISGITNIDNCIPFISGVISNQTLDSADSANAIAWMSGTDTLNVSRGAGSNGTVLVNVVVVEFTGIGWSVLHGRTQNQSDTGSVILKSGADGLSGLTGSVGNWNSAAIFHQYRGNNSANVDDSISDTSATYSPGGLDTVNWVFNANHIDSVSGTGAGIHLIHTLGASSLVVSRFTDTQSAAGAMSVNVTTAGMTDIANASVSASRTSSGSGTAYGRGWVNARITSTTNVELWCHRSGNVILTNIEIIDFSFLDSLGISSITPSELQLGATDVTISGIKFESLQGTGKFEISDNPTYGSGTVVQQTVTAWNDSTIIFDFIPGAIPLDTTIYGFVTNDSGDRNSAFSFYYGTTPYEDFIIGLNPDHYIPFETNFNEIIANNHATQSTAGPPTFAGSALTRSRLGSVQFNSATDKTEMPDSVKVNIANLNRRHMSWWFRVDQVQLTPAGVYEEGGNVNNMYAVLGFGNVMLANAADSGQGWKAQAWSSKKMTPNRVYNAQIRFEGSAYAGEFRLFIDGIIQPGSIGNPIITPNISSHSGDISFGSPDGVLDTGGIDVLYLSSSVLNMQDWCTWSNISLAGTDILDLFRKGAKAANTIISDSLSNMQADIETYDNTNHDDAALIMQIQAATDLDTSLTLTNQLFHDDASLHIQWPGSGVLTLTQVGTTNIDPSKLHNLGSGSIVLESSRTFTLDNILVGSEVRIYADDAGAGNNYGTELAGVESILTSTFQYNHPGTTDPVVIQVMKIGQEEFFQRVTLDNSNQSLTVQQIKDTNV